MLNRKTAALGIALTLAFVSNIPAFAGIGANGNAGVHYATDVPLTLACNSNGSEVGLGANLNVHHTTDLGLSLAFANPSVTWESASQSWVKKSGNGSTVKVVDGSDLTTVTLNVSASNFKKGSVHKGMGNPFVYFNDGVSWQLLGRCESTNQSPKTVIIRNGVFDIDGNISANTSGPCFTNSKSSQVGFGGHFDPNSATFSANGRLVYSNKLLDTSSGLKLKDIDVSNLPDNTVVDAYGYHLSSDNIGVSLNSSDLSGTFPFTQKQASGIGGNPNIWLKAGNGNFVLQGRCNTL